MGVCDGGHDEWSENQDQRQVRHREVVVVKEMGRGFGGRGSGGQAFGTIYRVGRLGTQLEEACGRGGC